MSDIDKQALRLKAEKATQGEWWSDSCGNEGTYGSGDDCIEGFTSYAVYDESNQILLDTLNSSAACIQEEYDGECHVAWDEVGQRNTEFIAAANPVTVLALLDELEAKEKYAKDRDAENEGLMLTVVRLRVEREAAERRIADLEAREVNLPKRSVGEVIHMSGFSRDYAEGWCSGNDNAIHEIRAAGISVKGE